MFTLFSNASWATIFRGSISWLTVFMLLPIVALPLGAFLFMIFPVAIVGMPFLIGSFYGPTQAAHHDAVVRASWRPAPMRAHAHA